MVEENSYWRDARHPFLTPIYIKSESECTSGEDCQSKVLELMGKIVLFLKDLKLVK